MLRKLTFMIVIIYALILRQLDCKRIELNETNAFLSIKSLLTDLKVEVERQGKVLDALQQAPHQCQSKSGAHSCAQLTALTNRSGIYELILPSYSLDPIRVAWDVDTQGGGWLIILRRMDGSVNFNRGWSVYKNGFGDLDGEFFLGLDKLHALTGERSQELLVLLEDFEGQTKQVFYEKFAIGNEQEFFALNTLSSGSGTTGDSLKIHHGMKFSTFDLDNDRDPNRHCAEIYTGGWWYNDCHASHLTGLYKNNDHGKGINWMSFRGHKYSLKRAVMMIRPRK